MNVFTWKWWMEFAFAWEYLLQKWGGSIGIIYLITGLLHSYFAWFLNYVSECNYQNLSDLLIFRFFREILAKLIALIKKNVIMKWSFSFSDVFLIRKKKDILLENTEWYYFSRITHNLIILTEEIFYDWNNFDQLKLILWIYIF